MAQPSSLGVCVLIITTISVSSILVCCIWTFTFPVYSCGWWLLLVCLVVHIQYVFPEMFSSATQLQQLHRHEKLIKDIVKRYTDQQERRLMQITRWVIEKINEWVINEWVNEYVIIWVSECERESEWIWEEVKNLRLVAYIDTI